jgi:putative phage-type endonuclease
LKIKKYSFENKNDWLQKRTENLNSTDIATLFNLNKYKSYYQLWNEKKSLTSDSIKSTEKMEWGLLLERTIANRVASIQGWTVRKINQYFEASDLKIASSFDFMIMNKEKGNGILEIKTTDAHVFRNLWQETENGIIMPDYIELQVQHQLLISKLKYAYIAVLIGGSRLEIIYRKRDDNVCNMILKQAENFWTSIENNQKPEPDYNLDADYICDNLYKKSTTDKKINACEKIEKLLNNYNDAKIVEVENTKLKKQYKAQILELISDAELVECDDYYINCGMTKENLGKKITEDMVGSITGARKSYRQFKICKKK